MCETGPVQDSCTGPVYKQMAEPAASDLMPPVCRNR